MAPTVDGVGGMFFRAKNPDSLAAWYKEHLGFPVPGQGMPWSTSAGPVVVAPFADDMDYFGGPQQFMFNFRVTDLDAFVDQLEAAGISQVKPQEEMEGIGRFAWVQDPEGNQIELWQPAS